ncbi:MAG TPA: hypothetical protein VHB77_13470 [Planctomycetaceae bacterium]|nr:hypothetical protein [Planctomycetaceae bacterium]
MSSPRQSFGRLFRLRTRLPSQRAQLQKASAREPSNGAHRNPSQTKKVHGLSSVTGLNWIKKLNWFKSLNWLSGGHVTTWMTPSVHLTLPMFPEMNCWLKKLKSLKSLNWIKKLNWLKVLNTLNSKLRLCLETTDKHERRENLEPPRSRGAPCALLSTFSLLFSLLLLRRRRRSRDQTTDGNNATMALLSGHAIACGLLPKAQLQN